MFSNALRLVVVRGGLFVGLVDVRTHSQIKSALRLSYWVVISAVFGSFGIDRRSSVAVAGFGGLEFHLRYLGVCLRFRADSGMSSGACWSELLGNFCGSWGSISESSSDDDNHTL